MPTPKPEPELQRLKVNATEKLMALKKLVSKLTVNDAYRAHLTLGQARTCADALCDLEWELMQMADYRASRARENRRARQWPAREDSRATT